ncbi:subtilisin [Colletotrichum camelliae]|nr:subtilisin [Colletotrichum camelliae]
MPTTTPTAEDEDYNLCEVRKFCKQKASGYRCVFHYVNDNPASFHQGDWEDAASSQEIAPDVSLEKLLRTFDHTEDVQTFRLTKRAKAELILSLARALYEIPRNTWLPPEWGPEHIFFQSGQYHSEMQVFGFQNPFISTRLSKNRATADTTELPNSNRFMLSFALLLIEIQTGKRIALERSPKSDQLSYHLTVKVATQSNEDDMTLLVRNVISACMKFTGLVAHGEGESAEERTRNVVLRDIVTPLYQEARSYSEKPKDDRIISISSQHRSELAPYFDPVEKSTYQPTKSSPIASQSMNGNSQLKNSEKKAVLCDGNKYSKTPRNPQHAKRALEFLQEMDRFTDRFIKPNRTLNPEPWYKRNVRVAVIDSGLVDVKSDKFILGARKRIKQQKTYIGQDCLDKCGHGTHVVRQLLKVAPCVELFVAKISKDMFIPSQELHHVTQAIKWAIDEHDVDIISLSLALDIDNLEIIRVLENAMSLEGANGGKGRIVLAAASNGGGNRSRASPASMRGVICVHASDGFGNKADFNPNPKEDVTNFSTLGVDILSRFEGEEVYISGTSYATPIAAGIVANFLHFARQNTDMSEEDLIFLHSPEGAERMLQGISTSRDTFDYICPWKRKDRLAYQTEDQTSDSLSDLLSVAAAVAKRARSCRSDRYNETPLN